LVNTLGRCFGRLVGPAIALTPISADYFRGS
jgi:hypothetical protein